MGSLGGINNKHGFTLIELSLSIAFLSILSIAIVLIIVNVISAYHRGLTLNDINSTGMDLVDDFRGTIQNSSYESINSICSTMYPDNQNAKNACVEDNASKSTSITRYAGVQIGNDMADNTPVFGAFCTGRYSYIWNSGYFFSGDNTHAIDVNPAFLSIKNNQGDETVNENFKLLKVRDRSREVCINALKAREQDGYYSGANNYSSKFEISESEEITSDPPVDLLDTYKNLAVYNLVVPTPASNDKNSLFYSISFILGTVQGGINVMATGNYCATPGGFNSTVENFDYCAINKFNFAVQATGG
ncbi:prepilin-type N-terminal cleavage/methylation domain-containing protein [Candidatus Saccharibacteria bacterium]|nr:prepilin-type N-terminal cleavage/methylation domain-containing protein [Candidatus Saccharibacteria bacterium]